MIFQKLFFKPIGYFLLVVFLFSSSAYALPVETPNQAAQTQAILVLNVNHALRLAKVRHVTNALRECPPHSKVCHEAVRNLRLLGSSALTDVRRLRGLLNEEGPPEVREAVLDSLSKIHVTVVAVFTALRLGLEADESSVRRDSAQALALLSQRILSLTELIKTDLGSPEADLRRNAAKRLRQTAAISTNLSALTKALSDSDPLVRESARESMSSLNIWISLLMKTMTQASADSDRVIKREVLEALDLTGPAFMAAVSVLKQGRGRAASEFFYEETAHSLQGIVSASSSALSIMKNLKGFDRTALQSACHFHRQNVSSSSGLTGGSMDPR